MRIDYDSGLPARMVGLPRDAHGRPVPWFVAWVDGKPDFRLMSADRFSVAIAKRLCWACGQPLGGYKAFLIGPMCAVNRNTAEPPCHRDCAIYCATHCDFLVNPQRGRREGFMPVDRQQPPGEMIRRNPGVALVWITKRFEPYVPPGGGTLFSLGDPTETLWFREGRAARRAEILESIDSGLPLLREMAEQEGPRAVHQLERQHEAALAHLPA